jgi:hypothetical protein
MYELAMIEKLFKPIIDDDIRFGHKANETIRDPQFNRHIAGILSTAATPAI